MDRPKYVVTEEDRIKASKLASMGFRHEDISKALSISERMLRKHFRSELETGATNANQLVMHCLFDMATSGENTAATIFWVNTRCALLERPRQNSEEQNEAPPQVIFCKDDLSLSKALRNQRNW